MKKSLLLLLGMLYMGCHINAHESRPLFIEITESSPGIYSLQYKIPSSIPDFNYPEVLMPAGFEPLGTVATYAMGAGLLKSQQYKSEIPLNGLKISIQYPVINPSVSSIVKVNLDNGLQFQAVLGPEMLTWQVPEEESFWGVAWQYALLGIEHILIGWDHLLFLICLIMVAGTGRKLLITITGFTLAHSITLALAALNIVQVPVPPVEAVIALSVVFLATEIILNNRDSLTFKYPIAVSSSFGLLHGFGFAAVLGDIGLPQKEVVSSLLFFNIGVEIGQVIFIVGAILVFWLADKAYKAIWSEARWVGFILQFQRVAIYLVGIIASYWVVERVAGFF